VTRGMAPRSIRSQIFLLATVPIIVLAFVTSGLWLMVNVNESRSAWASRLTGRAEMVADQLRLAGDASVENAVLQASAGAGITAEIVSAGERLPAPGMGPPQRPMQAGFLPRTCRRRPIGRSAASPSMAGLPMC
jgi:hypothetical protein